VKDSKGREIKHVNKPMLGARICGAWLAAIPVVWFILLVVNG